MWMSAHCRCEFAYIAIFNELCDVTPLDVFIMELFLNILARVAWTSTYTYILLLFVAAAFVAYVARPREHGQAVKRLFAGQLLAADEVAVMPREPSLHVHCLDGGKVVFRRLDVEGLTTSGAVSLAVTFTGSNVEIMERVTPGYHDDEPMAGAEFTIDMTGHEWRHVKWMNEENGLWCAFTLHVREGIDFTVALKR